MQQSFFHRWSMRLTRLRRGNSGGFAQGDSLYQRDGEFCPLLLGHRGAMSRAPENTLGAFQAAIEDGAVGVELDVQLSRDDVAIVLHDDTLDRTSKTPGNPRHLAAADLDLVDVGSFFPGWGFEKVPRLDEVLAAMPTGAVVNVELKGPSPRSMRLEEHVADVVAQHCPRVSVVVSSFHPAQLLAFQRCAPNVLLGLLLDHHALLPLRTAWVAPVLLPHALHPHCALVDKDFVAHTHRAGMRIHAWGMKRADEVERLLDLGVDGVIVDDVAATKKLFIQRGYAL